MENPSDVSQFLGCCVPSDPAGTGAKKLPYDVGGHGFGGSKKFSMCFFGGHA